MGRVQNAAMHRILHLAGLDDRVDRQQVDRQGAARHLVDAVHVGLCVFKENTAAPGCLHLQCHTLGRVDCRGRQSTGTHKRRAAQELPAIQ